ncbi:hypothetical protein MAPG_02137 [Magnaporthiopsis poae ATCC 64411]|uniref:AB hydrolase-1 domain-containing protein n=1 Tax=Magnaporthiopsis poae (strain ATCC 64411 / 73-15) TaxID=644358 RepID=A0A0C4DQJ3_MAGP6|nr:hypothetical protein MAPG_02137 [Magnaporthiopsis poae ATCC 64411]
MHSFRHWCATMLFTSTALGDIAPSAGADTGFQNTTNSLIWGRCPSWLNKTLVCANISVPLDWNDPGGEKVVLGFAKLSARDPSKRIGNLFVNPGGPGNQGSGSLSITARRPQRLDPEVLDRFDIIGLDPRGVGLSTPVQCDKDIFNKRARYFVRSQEEYDDMVAGNKALWESCLAKTGRLLYFMDTVNAAKDHEAVRLALGGEKASFVGFSYGSQLYAQYAELYPDGFRAMLLDGALQHSQGETANVLIEATSYEATLKQFFAWCAADATVATSCRTDVSQEELYLSIQGGLEHTADWPAVAQGLADTAAKGDATIFSITPRTGDAFYDSDAYAYRAVLCQDWTRQSASFVDLRQKQVAGEVFAPLVKGHTQSYALQAFCIGWGAPVTNPPRPFKYEGATPILLTNALYDPSTSYVWAVGLAKELNNTTLLTRNGSGHTSLYLRNGSTPAAQTAYLVNLTLPAPGTIFST